MSELHSDALVFFGATGDLAYKKIFPALQAMVEAGPPRRAGHRRGQGGLDPRPAAGPRAGTASRSTAALDAAAFAKLCGAAPLRRRRLQRPRHVRTRCASELGDAQRPAHYLAIPPSLFGTVVEQLASVRLRDGTRASSSRSRSAATSRRRGS